MRVAILPHTNADSSKQIPRLTTIRTFARALHADSMLFAAT